MDNIKISYKKIPTKIPKQRVTIILPLQFSMVFVWKVTNPPN